MPYGAVTARRSDGRKVWVFFNRDYQPVGRTDYVREHEHLSRGYVEYDLDVDGVVVPPVYVRKLKELAVTDRGDVLYFYSDGRGNRMEEVLRLLWMRG